MRLRSVGSLLRPVVAAAVTAAVLVAAPAAAAASDFARPAESRFDELLRLPQWRQVMPQLPPEAARVNACLRGAECGDAGALRIAALVASGRGRTRMAQLEQVHAAINEQPYREDRDQFGREDLWQTPLAFAARGGDCEDFAIAKYFVLKLLGFRDADLRIAVLTSTERDEIHAVLLARVGTDWLVLDNREDQPLLLDGYGGWTLQYAVTEAGGFRYLSGADPALLRAPAQR